MPEDTLEDHPPLEILFQDERYVAINKPPRLLVHRSEIAAQEDRFALQVLRDQLGKIVYPVHRLDKPTSGVLVFALDREAMAELTHVFERCEISKTYHAIVRGFSPKSGQIDHPLRLLNDFKGPNKKEKSQEAETEFATLSNIELPQPTERHPSSRYSFVELHPKTGRRHQLRRHMVHINCPIVGDTRHGDNTLNKRFKERYGNLRLMLHASQLDFQHPFSKKPIHIKAPIEQEMQTALENLKLNFPTIEQ